MGEGKPQETGCGWGVGGGAGGRWAGDPKVWPWRGGRSHGTQQVPGSPSFPPTSPTAAVIKSSSCSKLREPGQAASAILASLQQRLSLHDLPREPLSQPAAGLSHPEGWRPGRPLTAWGPQSWKCGQGVSPLSSRPGVWGYRAQHHPWDRQGWPGRDERQPGLAG